MTHLKISLDFEVMVLLISEAGTSTLASAHHGGDAPGGGAPSGMPQHKPGRSWRGRCDYCRGPSLVGEYGWGLWRFILFYLIHETIAKGYAA
jgi:hypothetical protein